MSDSGISCKENATCLLTGHLPGYWQANWKLPYALKRWRTSVVCPGPPSIGGHPTSTGVTGHWGRTLLNEIRWDRENISVSVWHVTSWWNIYDTSQGICCSCLAAIAGVEDGLAGTMHVGNCAMIGESHQCCRGGQCSRSDVWQGLRLASSPGPPRYTHLLYARPLNPLTSKSGRAWEILSREWRQGWEKLIARRRTEPQLVRHLRFLDLPSLPCRRVQWRALARAHVAQTSARAIKCL